MSAPYSLNCSVCQGEYFSRDEWSRHLTTIRHQTLAKEECLQKWNKPNGLKERCLVVFASFPLTPSSVDGDGGAEKVIRHFSTKAPKIFVTDFVCWDDRARYGILQFESKNKALEMSKRVGSKEVLVDNNARVQVKWAGELLELEWDAVLPTEDVNISARGDSRAVSTNNETTGIIEPMSCDESCSIGNVPLPVDEKDIFDTRTMPTNNGVGYLIPTMSARTTFNMKQVTSNLEKLVISTLEKLARQRNWDPPEFQLQPFTSNDGCLTNYVCSVTVNGVEYRGGGKSKQTAKRQAALNCLRKLTTPLAPTSTQGYVKQSDNVNDPAQVKCHNSKPGEAEPKKRAIESDKDNQPEELSRHLSKKIKTDKFAPTALTTCKNAISLLHEHAQRNHWPPPTFTFRYGGNPPVFSCSVKVNGVDYYSDTSFPKVQTYEEARLFIAQLCLNKLSAQAGSGSTTTSEDTNIQHNGTSTSNSQMKTTNSGHQNNAANNRIPEMYSNTNLLLKDAVPTLENLARERKWNPPKFKYSQPYTTPEGQVKYLSCVTLNGVDYKPTDEYARTSTLKAKQQAAIYCLKTLTATQDDATPQPGNTTDSCQGRYRGSGEGNGTRKQSLDSDERNNQNGYGDDVSQFSENAKTEASVPTTEIRGTKTTKARSTLAELAQRNHWKPPRYKLLNAKVFKGTPLYSFSVNVNGVEYYPDTSIPKADTKAMAKRFMAELCLKKLKKWQSQ